MTLAVPAPSAGTRVTCYCKDCQTAARHFGGQDDILGPAGGTEIWQTTPDRITLEQGAEHLAIMRLSPKGLYRWVARCCETPMLNTMSRVNLPFVGIVLRQAEVTDEATRLGPSRCHAYTRDANPGPDSPAKDQGFALAAYHVLQRMALAWGSGRHRQNPLLRDGGEPIAPVNVLSLEARQASVPKHLQ